MATFYGSDTACVSDLSRIDLQITSPQRLIGERVARRLQTRRGGLAAIGDTSNGGYDVRQLLLARMAPAQLAQAQQLITAEATKDEQVASADVDLSFQGGILIVTLRLVSSAGPFTLTMNVSSLTVDLVFG